MTKRQIRLLARKLLNGESVLIDRELYRAVSYETKPECSVCELCGINCPAFSTLSYVCCEIDQASDAMWHLVKVN